MKLISLTIARNEAWTLGPAIRAALRWVDSAVIMDHASTDRTPEVIRELVADFPGRVHALREDDPVWREMAYRQKTLDVGRSLGGSHFSLIDADEMLTENLVPTIRETVESLRPGDVLQPAWLCLWRSMKQFRQDQSIWSRAWVSWAFCDAPHLHWTTREFGYDLHHRHPMGSVPVKSIPREQGGVLHFQHANWRRLLAKQAAYKMVEVIRWGAHEGFRPEQINARYDPTSNEDGIGYMSLHSAWTPPELVDVKVGAEPWQESECRRLVAEHGREKFSRLNLYGMI